MEEQYTLDQIEQAILKTIERGEHGPATILHQNAKNRMVTGRPIPNWLFIDAVKYHLAGKLTIPKREGN